MPNVKLSASTNTKELLFSGKKPINNCQEIMYITECKCAFHLNLMHLHKYLLKEDIEFIDLWLIRWTCWLLNLSSVHKVTFSSHVFVLTNGVFFISQ